MRGKLIYRNAFSLLLLFSIILGLSGFLSAISTSAFAATDSAIMILEVSSASATPTSIDYTLPYPGLLPDSPLYKLKTLRDIVIGWFISDPTQKASFDILQSDKRYAGSLMLLDSEPNQKSLALDTLSKANNYMEDALKNLVAARSQGRAYVDIAQNALMSNQEHQQILDDMAPKFGKTSGFFREQERTASFIDSLQKNILQK